MLLERVRQCNRRTVHLEDDGVNGVSIIRVARGGSCTLVVDLTRRMATLYR